MKKSKPMPCSSKHQPPPCTVLYPFCSAFLILVLVLQGGLAILNRNTYVVHNDSCTNRLNNQEHKIGDNNNNSSVNSLSYAELSKLVHDNYDAIKGIIKVERDGGGGDICEGRRVFLYDVPREFNTDLASECTQVGRGKCGARWGCLYCGGLENEGLGEQIKWNNSDVSTKFGHDGHGEWNGVLEDTVANRTLFRNVNGFSANYSVRLLPAHSWFRTHQFALEPIFHAKMRRYECLTPDPALADAFYVPYYAGQDFALSIKTPQLEARDTRVNKFVKWLVETETWKLTKGRRHMMALGRQPLDLSRPVVGVRRWGIPVTTRPELANFTFFWWELGFSGIHEIGVPYPTAFHPSSDADLALWQDMVKNAKREWVVSYLGSAKRRFRDPNILEFRKELKRQCDTAPRHCRFMDCTMQFTRSQLPCEDHPETALLELASAIFCLQPPGDTPTRKSVFDSLLTGCIPVFFSNLTAHLQYSPFGFLPHDPHLYSITLSQESIANSSSSFVQYLLNIPPAHIHEMQQTIIYKIMPHIIYAHPTGSTTFHDAMDIGLQYLLTTLNHD